MYGIASVKSPLAMRSGLGVVSAELSERRYCDPADCAAAGKAMAPATVAAAIAIVVDTLRFIRFPPLGAPAHGLRSGRSHKEVSKVNAALAHPPPPKAEHERPFS